MPHIYGLDDQQLKWTDQAQSIAKEVLARHAADVDAKARFPEESISALAKAGFFGLCVPRELGGGGQAPRTFVAVAEELARACGSTAMIWVMHVSAAKAIESSQTLATRDAVLREIAAGKHLTTLALSEKGSRSQFWAPVSKLVEQGAGFTTSAQKSWATSAHRADSYVSSAQKPGAASPLESTVYFAKRDNRAIRTPTQFDGLGLRGNDSAPVTIEDLKVERGDLISPLGEGAKTMLEVVLPWFAIGSSGMAHGLCRAAVDATGGHLAGTTFEHMGQQLRDLPTLRARLADMSARTEASRALLAYTCGELEQPSATTPLYVLQTRMVALQTALDVTDGAMRACGGAAFSKQVPIERIFRDARAGWVMAPTWDHLADFSGKALTGLPLF